MPAVERLAAGGALKVLIPLRELERDMAPVVA
jgi:hypothetical protein